LDAFSQLQRLEDQTDQFRSKGEVEIFPLLDESGWTVSLAQGLPTCMSIASLSQSFQRTTTLKLVLAP
jgi:hypothetical protein